MAIVPMRLMLNHAMKMVYGIPAYNVNNMEQIQAIMQAAHEANNPVILQASRGARKYAGENFLRHLILAAVETYPHIPIAMHQDHGNSPATCYSAIRHGFTSVMMDGSLEADAKTQLATSTTSRLPQSGGSCSCRWRQRGRRTGLPGFSETGMGDQEDGHGAEGVLSTTSC